MKQFEAVLIKLAPVIFVLLWSTGFIGAKYGLPYAEPFIFLIVRFAITLLILTLIFLAFMRPKITRTIIVHSMVTGVFVHAVYLGGVFYAIANGMAAGVAALIAALQPLIAVVLAAFLLKERASRLQISMLVIALLGVVLTLLPNLLGGNAILGLSGINLFAVGCAVLGISFGSVYQKRYLPKVDLRTTTYFQYIGATIPMVIFSLILENQTIEWTGDFIFALFWLVIVLSIGAVGLLMYLIERNSAISTASLFYLVPVSTAIIAYFLFDEKLQPVQFLGAAIVIFAVAVGSRKKAPTTS